MFAGTSLLALLVCARGASAQTATSPSAAPANALVTPAAAGAAQPTAIPLPEVLVTGHPSNDGYNVPNAVSATKTDTPIQQTPFAVQVVPEQTMRDQQTTRLQDAILGNVSSVAPQPNGLSDNTNFTIRGFNTGPAVYQDGLLMPYTMNIDPANLQLIEVMKGPAGALYGRMAPGGMVDIITRNPDYTPHYGIQETIGSFGLTRTTVDATGPLTADKTWLYRLDLDYTHAGSFVNDENSQNIFIAPAITWKPNDAFQITIKGQYQNVRNVDSDPNFPAIGNRPAHIPISTYLEDPGVTRPFPDKMEREFIGYSWSYKFADNWQVTNRLAFNNSPSHVTNMYFAYVDQSGNGTNSLQYGGAGEQTFSTNLELTGKFPTGPVSHTILVGTDYLDFYTWFNGFYDYDAQDINIFNPTAAYNTINLATALNPANGFALLSKQSWYGVYTQDTISAFGDRVHLLLGGRYDWANTGSGVAFGDPNAWADAKSSFKASNDGGFSPRIGLSVQVLPWATIYANWSRSLGLSNVTAGVTASGQPLGPQWAEQEEVGVKTEFFDKRLAATVALFNITQNNVPVAVVGSPGVFNLAGQARSRGVELDVTGKVNEYWSVIATYSHDETEVVKGYPATAANIASELPVAGSRLPTVPMDMASVWAKYTGTSSLDGWNFAGGVTWVGSASGDPGNSFEIPSYAVVRGMVSYKTQIHGQNVIAQLNIDNALNKTYFYGSTSYGNRYSLTPGVPRSIIGTLRAEF
jgi:iron complex outermembrane recepter protein